MQKRKRVINILIAGTLSLLMLTVFLAFRETEADVVSADTVVITEPVLDVDLVGEYEADISALESQIESLQSQNQELMTAVQTMQGREVQYQEQIETANQTISELSAQSQVAGIDGFGAFAAPPEGRHH